MGRTHPAIVLVTCCSLLAPSLPASRARADTSHAPTAADRTRAATLKRLADAEMESLRYAEALNDYDEAYRLTADPALLYNRARVLQGLERFTEALESLDRFAREASPELRSRVPKLAELRSELSSRVATLTLHCSVEGARVLVRNQVVGTTPVTGPIHLNAGRAELEVDADGYVPFREEIDLPRAGALEIDAKLVAREPKGRLFVSGHPEGSNVFVDGRAFGLAPAELLLSPGNHEVLLSHGGFQDAKVFAVVVEDQRKDVDLTLEKNPPIVAKWWFWTSIAVVAATTAAVAVAMTTDKAAGHGDIPPGQVSGPLLAR